MNASSVNSTPNISKTLGKADIQGSASVFQEDTA